MTQGWEPGVEVHVQVNEATKVVELHPTVPPASAWVEIAEDGGPVIRFPEGTTHDYDMVEAIREDREARADYLASSL